MALVDPFAYSLKMQVLAAICPLEITSRDRSWIEYIRARYDPQHTLVEPHFTLVFPVAGFSRATFEQHLEHVAAATPPIAFSLGAARVVRDSLRPRSHIFLLPDEGDVLIRDLHRRLYEGELSAHLRTDIPYEPHVTVAAFDAHFDAETTCREISRFKRINGYLRALAAMSIEASRIVELQRFPLR
jgi:2'-5' RNA ligase